MPGPVTHIVLADKILQSRSRTPPADFYVGSLFPDIRMLGVIDRERTHLKNVVLTDALTAKSEFQTGFLLHSWIDQDRERFVRNQGIYDQLPDDYLSTVALKICEDAELYEQSSNWRNIIQALNELSAEERHFGIDDYSLLLWHRMHQEYLTGQPLNGYKKFFTSGGFQESDVSRLNELIDTIQANGLVDTYLMKYIDSLDPK